MKKKKSPPANETIWDREARLEAEREKAAKQQAKNQLKVYPMVKKDFDVQKKAIKTVLKNPLKPSTHMKAGVKVAEHYIKKPFKILKSLF